MTRFVVAVVAALLLVPSVSFAKDFEHKDAKLSIWVPDGWQSETDDSMLVVKDPGEEIGIMFIVMDATDVEKAVEEMGKALDGIIKDAEPDGEPTETKVNGMDALFLDGTGKVEGEPVLFSVGLVVTPAGKVMMMLGMAQTAKYKKHAGDVEKVLHGVKPLK